MQIKTVFRLYSCLFYELIIQIALWFVITFLILFFFNFKAIDHPNIFLFILWVSSGIYFLYSWMYGGQTLAMKAWKLKLIPPKGHKFIFFLFIKVCLSNSRCSSFTTFLFKYSVWWKGIHA